VLSVAGASERVAGGDLSARVPASREEDEIGRLARAFNQMTEALERNRGELQRRTEDLERSNRELEQYAQVTSHDLQAPLATIRLYVDVLGRRLGAEEQAQARELLDGIVGSLDRMRALIRDLLEYSRAGRGDVAHTPVQPRELVEQALENLAGPIADRGAQIVTEPLPVVRGDRRQLGQVFQNLIGNAVKFSDEGAPRVAIAGRLDGEFAHFTVTDNGIGIDPAHAERIFEPFQRLQPEERYEGTGIGLAICQKVVAAHGGRIWAEGEPGAGSVFHFTLPAEDGDGRPAAPASVPAAASPA
jgi:light-regulated signal transduction histidine kinase (bacteriophytochrome)